MLRRMPRHLTPSDMQTSTKQEGSMPVTVTERYDSRRTSKARGTNSSHERIYTVTGVESSTEAINNALIYAPPVLAVGTSLLVITTADADCLDGNELYSVTVQWGSQDKDNNKEQPETGDIQISLDITGETSTLYQSKASRWYDIKTKTEHPVKGDPLTLPIKMVEGKPEGAEIISPSIAYSLTAYVEYIDSEWVRKASDLVGKINKNKWKGFEKGEVLFTGVRGQQRPRGDWEMQLNFAIRQNKAIFETAGINITELEGWTYVWVEYELAEGDDSVISKARKVHADRIYDYADFDDLGV